MVIEGADRTPDPTKVKETLPPSYITNNRQSYSTTYSGASLDNDYRSANISPEEYARLPVAAREKVDDARARIKKAGLPLNGPRGPSAGSVTTTTDAEVNKLPVLANTNADTSRSAAGFSTGFGTQLDTRASRFASGRSIPQGRIPSSTFANAAVLNRIATTAKLPESVRVTANPTQVLNPFVFNQLVNQAMRK